MIAGDEVLVRLRVVRVSTVPGFIYAGTADGRVFQFPSDIVELATNYRLAQHDDNFPETDEQKRDEASTLDPNNGRSPSRRV